MDKYGHPYKVVALVRQLHGIHHLRVSVKVESPDSFQATHGVKQGCVMKSSVKHTYYKLFNLRHSQGKRKVQIDNVRLSLFADNCVLNTAFPGPDFQLDGVTISTMGAEVIYKRAPGKP